MSAIATTRARVTVSDRLLTAAPLACIYLWLSVIYCFEAWKRATPWLFTDELELTQISRSIAATGHAARRGEPYSFHSLYTFLIAPLWRIDDVAVAFAAIKYVDSLVMASVLFPTYFLARMIVGRTPALFAAAGAAMIPSLAYSSWIVEETLAYPYAALCFLLIAKALYVRSRGWIAGAVVASAIAPLVRGELSMIPVLFGFALLFMAWSSAPARAIRSRWSRADWAGFLVLLAGAIILVSGFMSHHSRGWLMNTAYNWTKQRIFVYGDWAAGALAVGLGAAPLAIGLAALAPARGERRTQSLRVFRCVALGGIIVFGLYTAMKAAYLSQTWASRSEERNLIYICPLLFVGTAHVLAHRRINLWALGASAAYVLYLVLGSPLYIGGGYYSDALGLAILQQANRYFLLDRPEARVILVAALAVGVLATVALTRLRNGGGTAVAVGLATLMLAWTGTAEIAAAAGNVTTSRDLRPTIGEPFTWVDDATHLKPTLYLGQQVADQNAEWLLEFWNRSIKTVSSLDGTVGGPGPSGAPNLTRRGRLYWTQSPADAGKVFDYAVEEWPCVDFAGTHVETHPYRGGVWKLVQLTKPNRLRATCQGIYADGWSGESDSTYYRFVGDSPGWLRIALARPGFPATRVELQVADVRSEKGAPTFGRVVRKESARIPAAGSRVLWVRTPAAPFAVHVVIDKKEIPADIDPSRKSDTRLLGAQTSFLWFAKKPAKG